MWVCLVFVSSDLVLQFRFRFVFHKTIWYQFKLTFNNTLAKQPKVDLIHITHVHTYTHQSLCKCQIPVDKRKWSPDTLLEGSSLRPI